MITRRAGATLGTLLATALVVVAFVQATNQADAGRAAGNRVVRVIDGDTVVIHLSGRDEHVRLIGIDTPETVKPNSPVECFGREASARTKALLPAGTAVRLERDVEARDHFGRLLAYVFRVGDGTFVNLALAEEGYAMSLTIPPNLAYADRFAAAVADARRDGRGLWGACPGGER